jgi:P4 family phage/plasmid primase-like protien
LDRKEAINELLGRKNEDGAEIFGRLGQAKEFHKRNPFAYDKAGLFWIWDNEDKCYKQSDETDILNNIRRVLNVDTIESKAKNEIVTSLKQVGRERLPKELPNTWIQFKKTVVDIKTGETFEASPEYFYTSPIPWDIGLTEDTPTIDKLFRDWMIKVGIQDESYVDTLQEVTAYSIEDSAFMQSLIWLCGSGSNGKGCFLNFIMKFLGIQNVCSSDLKILVTRNFETSALYKKKAVLMGEVDTYDLTNTNLLKQLSGEDLIRFEFKGKTPFSQKSTTTCFIASNALPVTPDRSNGFYRRNLIIDFPNVFNVGKDVVAEIPDVEYMNFAKKCLRILKELHTRGSFTNGGTIEERRVRYEDRSNPIVHFISSSCSESPTDHETFSVFLKTFQDYLRNNRLRPMSSIQTSKALKMEGYDVKSRHVILNRGTDEEQDTHITTIFGLKLLDQRGIRKI